MRNKRVAILGTTGMLGGTVFRYFFRNTDFDLVVVNRVDSNIRLPKLPYLSTRILQYVDTQTFLQKYDILNVDYIVNCVGLIKPFIKKETPNEVYRAVKTNVELPYLLSTTYSDTIIINIQTDCVFSGKNGPYNESSVHDALDVYGKTKSLGEFCGKNIFNLRCSIIGHEYDGRKNSLLEWFLSQPNGSELKGFTNHLWNGITTLQFAKFCHTIVKNDFEPSLEKMHVVPFNWVNKHELLEIFKTTYEKDVVIKRVEAPEATDRRLSTQYPDQALWGQHGIKNICEMVEEQAEWYRTL